MPREHVHMQDEEERTAGTAGKAWIQLSPEEAARALGADVTSEEAGRLLSLLLTEPSTRAFVRVEAAMSAEGDASLAYLVPGTRIFINRTQLLDLRGDVLAGVAVWVLSHSLTWSAAVGLFQKTTRSVRHLSAEGVAVLLIVLELADGDRPVPIDAIAERFDGEREDLDRELASLSRRAVVWAEGSGWRVAP